MSVINKETGDAPAARRTTRTPASASASRTAFGRAICWRAAAFAAALLAAGSAFGDDMLYWAATTETFSEMISTNVSVWVGNSDKNVFASDWCVWKSSNGSLDFGITQTEWKNIRVSDLKNDSGRLKIESGLYHAMNDIVVGGGNNGEAHLWIDGGRMESLWWMTVGDGTNNTSTVEVSGDGVLFVGTGGGEKGSRLRLGPGTNSSSSINVSDNGSLTCLEIFMAEGDGARATCTMSGGTMSVGSFFKGAGTATLNLNGGRLAATNEGTFIPEGISCAIGGNTAISSALPITIAPAFTGSGTVTVSVTSQEGSITMPVPASSSVTLKPDSATKMETADGFATFTYSVYNWTDSEQTPADGMNVVVPEETEIVFADGSADILSLLIEGSLTQGAPETPELRPTLTTTGISGSGTFAFNWGTLVAATNGVLVASGVDFTIGGDPEIFTAYPVKIETAPTGEGNLYVTITDPEGSLVMPTPASSISLQHGPNTKMVTSGGYTSFFHDSVEIWEDSSKIPADGANVVVPSGVTIDYTPTGTNTFDSLLIDGMLVINAHPNHVEDKFRLRAGDSGLTVEGSGTIAFAASAKDIYNDSAVSVPGTMTLRIQRTIAEARKITNNEVLLQFGKGSAVGAAMKIANSRRSVTLEYVNDDDGNLKYMNFVAGELPPNWTSSVKEKGQIVWDAAKDITGDAADVSQEGTFVDGYYHVMSSQPGFRSTTYTLNGMTFHRYYSSGDYSATIGFSQGFNLSSSRTCNPVYTSGYEFLLSGAMRCNNGATGGYTDFTIGGLTEGHAYLVQVFCEDSTTTAAAMYVSDTNETKRIDVKLNVTAPTVGGRGQYVIGRFIAAGDTQTFRIGSYGSSVARENFMLWRDITESVVWSGGETDNGTATLDGTWDFSGNNWTDFSGDYMIWTNSVIGFAYSAVIATNANVIVSNNVYASTLTLSGGANISIPSPKTTNKLHINTDIIAAGDASFSAAADTVEIGGAIKMTNYGTFELNAPSIDAITLERGEVLRMDAHDATKKTTLNLGEAELYGDTIAHTNSFHARYRSPNDIRLSSLSGSGHIVCGSSNPKITLEDGNVTNIFAGKIETGTFNKTGNGTLKLIGENVIGSMQIDAGTLALATPADLTGFTYDFDATRSDTIDQENGVVTQWRDAYGGGIYLAPKASDTVYDAETEKVVDATYTAPTYAEDAFGDMPGLVSGSFRMDTSATEYQSTLFTVMKLTGDELGTPRLIVDASERGSAEQPYRIRISINGNSKPAYYDVLSNYSESDTGWLAVNGVYGTNATFALDTPYVVSAPWHWTRTGNNSNNGWRHIAYGWGAPMAWGEIISYSRMLTLEEKVAVEEYLMRKWGMSDEVYAPFGKSASVVVGASGTFDAGGMEIVVGGMEVSGTLKGVSGVTVTGDVTFKSGSKIYIDPEDATAGFMTVKGKVNGKGQPTFYIKNSDGSYRRTHSWAIKQLDSGKLVFTKQGFTVRVR